jgi:3-oxoacyl-[acyl-carrier protein] reductase
MINAVSYIKQLEGAPGPRRWGKRKMELGLKGKIALVGGASRGMGLGIAQELAREGANVVMVSRGGELLESEATRIRSAGGNAIAVGSDLSSNEGVAHAVQ